MDELWIANHRILDELTSNPVLLDELKWSEPIFVKHAAVRQCLLVIHNLNSTFSEFERIIHNFHNELIYNASDHYPIVSPIIDDDFSYWYPSHMNMITKGVVIQCTHHNRRCDTLLSRVRNVNISMAMYKGVIIFKTIFNITR